MYQQRLTDSLIRSAKADGKPVKLSDGGGLYLMVMPQGGKYWRYAYRFAGKQKTLALGTFPDIRLALARERHLAARRQLAEGIDPGAEKQSKGLSFETVAHRWHKHWAVNKTERHAAYVLKRLEADIFPEIGHLSIGELTPASFRDAVQKIEARGVVDVARRNLQTCGQIMRYAVSNDLVARNPVAEVKPADMLKPRRKKRNYARVGESELPQLLRDIDAYVGAEHTRYALQLMALTFVRTSELIAARWEEFDLDAARWNIPPERMKMRNPHIVPLSKQALAVLDHLKRISYGRDHVFPSDIPDRPGHMSNNTILYALYRMGYRGRMTGHGFRGVASTILHEQGWNHDHIELQLAHQEQDETSSAYNHALYLKDRTKMMQAWADYLDAARRRSVVQELAA